MADGALVEVAVVAGTLVAGGCVDAALVTLGVEAARMIRGEALGDARGRSCLFWAARDETNSPLGLFSLGSSFTTSIGRGRGRRAGIVMGSPAIATLQSVRTLPRAVSEMCVCGIRDLHQARAVMAGPIFAL